MDYSRFDNIQCSSDEEDEPAARPPQPPPNVMDDLEDYFRRMDERRAEQEAEGGTEGSQAPMSVDRLDEQQLASLKAVCFTEGSSSYSECSVCLADFAAGESLVQLPCAAGHLFHAACAHAALARSVFCPLCRVDVRPALAASEPQAAASRPPLSPRQLGFTRDGGVILSYEPNPPAEVPRPSYIPRELHGQAGRVEIMYPDHGVARVWRVPR